MRRDMRKMETQLSDAKNDTRNEMRRVKRECDDKNRRIEELVSNDMM